MHHLRQLHLHNLASATLPPDPGDPAAASAAAGWAAPLLRDCAAAVGARDSARAHHLLWALNELASPYGDREQRLAFHFLQALFCRATGSGTARLRTLSSAHDSARSFDSTRRVLLRFQEAAPWSAFGHAAANGAILEAMEGEAKLHIVDLSSATYCTQWPTLLEALATRSSDADTPHLRLTVVASTPAGEEEEEDPVMAEVGRRMERFARLMGVPFEFHHLVGGVPRLADLQLRDDEAVAVNCLGALRRVPVDERGALVAMLRTLNPKVVTVVEEEADFSGDDFGRCFEECMRFYTLFFEVLEESFPVTSDERLALERECSRGVVSVLGCEHGGEGERREKSAQWCERLVQAFSPADLSDDVVDDLRALLKRYPAGRWSLLPARAEVPGLYLAWKEEPVVWASAWKM